MTDQTTSQELNSTLDQYAPPETAAPALGNVYKVVAGSKVAVSRHFGKVAEGKKNAAAKVRKPYETAWQEALRYYNNDQSRHRDQDAGLTMGNPLGSQNLVDAWTETENVVFANATTLLPGVYAKNPVVEVTGLHGENDQFATMVERLVNNLFSLKDAPGLNMKPKARRAVLSALLTNRGWLEIGWTFKESSHEGAMEQLQALSAELADPTTEPQRLYEIEGELLALEKHLDVLNPEGPFVRTRPSEDVFIDPDSTEQDLSDARYLFVCEYINTDYLNARYATRGTDDNWVSVYEPTHVLPASAGSAEELVNNFTLFAEDVSTDYGYTDTEAYNAAKRTKVWLMWDKTTRRVYMFYDKDWSWPIWVWDDPYGLPRFFPFYSLSFYDNPVGQYAKGEVSYYVDQQDGLNDLNSERRSTRRWLRRNILFNESVIDRETIEQYLKGPDGTARGIRIPPDAKLGDVVFVQPPPSFQFNDFFDMEYRRLLEAIDRISSVSATQRGVEFKTNTTNKAIESYNSATQTRLDEKIDLIEDFIGDVAWGLIQLCCHYMQPDTVRTIIGPGLFQTYPWSNVHPNELRMRLACRVVGGSAAKPTSLSKRQEALEIAQVLGQFASASPAIVLLILRMFEEAFDGIIIKDEDWELIKQTMLAGQQQAGAGPTAPGGAPPQGAGIPAGPPGPAVME